MKDLVSVIIPTYKRSEKLDRAIQSVKNQSYKNFEVVIVDDNNPDTEYRKNTENHMKKYKNDERIKYFKMEKNGGGAAARNYGIEKAKGEYICFLDDDDEFTPDKIEVQLKHMKKNNLDASFSNEIILNENEEYCYKKDYKGFKPEKALEYHLTEMIVGPQTFMYKSKVLREIKGFDIVPSGQEYILMYKTILAGYKIGYLDRYLVKIYMHDGERISTSQRKLEGERNLYNIKRKHFDILNFLEKKRVIYEWRINSFRYYKDKDRKKYFLYFILIIFAHPLNVFKVLNNKFQKLLIKNKKDIVFKIMDLEKEI